MHNLIKQIQADNYTFCEDSVNPDFLSACQGYLQDTYQIKLPKDYCLLVKYANGLHSPLATIFGIMPETISDIVSANEDNQMFDKNNYLILGYNNFDWLVYNQQENCYQTYDKHDYVLLDTYADLKTVIDHWFIIPD